ncbi:Carbonic anhydrase [hydrothermal vent metagenome]|uniref:carbonic anhydrase n=1 Tax=hydrothermal vent metagenome TaxID=652676 RepID=A0A1W1BCF9_9ZZZZ
MKLSLIAGKFLVASSLFANAHGVHWGYTGKEGPEFWGDLNPKYSMCKKGRSQSPINITKKDTLITEGLEPIKFEYQTSAYEIVNNGHSIQVNIKDGSFIEIDGKKFKLKQFHFHSPSENRIEGKSFPLEAHFVHVAKDGSIAVVAVLFENGKENPYIKKIWEKMPKKEAKKSFELSAQDINKLLPKDKKYYRFSGSLTTPPCSEGVRWFVLKEYPEVSMEEVMEFTHTMHHANNRPTQPLNARKVLQ